jgi:hypothetical protein
MCYILKVSYAVPWFLTKSHGGPCEFCETSVGIVGDHVVGVAASHGLGPDRL